MVLEDNLRAYIIELDSIERRVRADVIENRDISQTEEIKNFIKAHEDLQNCIAHLNGTLLLYVVKADEKQKLEAKHGK